MGFIFHHLVRLTQARSREILSLKNLDRYGFKKGLRDNLTTWIMNHDSLASISLLLIKHLSILVTS